MNAADFPRVGLAEAIRKLEEMPRFVEDRVREASAGQLAARPGPAPGEFSLREHACHLRDLEREGYLLRVRRMLAETAPELAGFDGTALAQARNYRAQDAHAAARDFAAARLELLGIVAALGEAELAREALFGGQRICLVDLIAMIVDHDRSHREEIEALPWR